MTENPHPDPLPEGEGISPIGYIVGETHPMEFTFVSDRESTPPRLEYVTVPDVEERINGQLVPVEVLAQVQEIGVSSPVISDELTFGETETLLRNRFGALPKVLCRAKVVGYILERKVHTSRSAALPGQAVYVASDELLEAFFSNNVRAGMEVGTLITRDSVPVLLDPNGLRRHLAVIAQTGAGKSYLVGKVLESLLDLGGTILVFDPNSDYVQMRKAWDDKDKPYAIARPTELADRIDVYRIPGLQGRRYPDEMVGLSEEFTVKFSSLEPDEVSELAGVPSSAANIRSAIQAGCKTLKKDGVDYRPTELKEWLLMDAATDRNDDMKTGASRAVKYVEILENYPIWGFKDVDVEHLIKPRHMSVIDLAGADKSVSAYVVDRALRSIWARATTGQLVHPVFVVLEEAHNLVPADRERRESLSSRIINTVASEGRKFKVFLIVITQRPSKIHQDTLSQCGSQLIMRLTNPDDQIAVQKASEAISSDLLRDLPALDQGEAIVLGTLTRVPAMIKVGRRRSAEGGSDVDLVEALQQAAQDSKLDKVLEESMAVVRRAEVRQEEEW
ncbi:MAG TPA: ATP-binding protein [Chloroflexota bacterium]|nr:ATP-binding protein [Chloroflexota bacterium]